MKTKIVELKQKRAKLIKQARDLNEKAEAEDRDLTTEEQTNFDALMSDADELRSRAERMERMSDAQAELGSSDDNRDRRMDPDEQGDDNSDEPRNVEFTSRGLRGLNGEQRAWQQQREWRHLAPTITDQYRQDYRNFIRGESVSRETRALQADLDTQGGYLITPLEVVDALIKAIDDVVYIRQWATVMSVGNADSLGVPTLENDPADADWTTELATGDEDSTMSFGRRELHPHPLAKRIKISRKLLMKVPSSEDLVMRRLAYKFGITEEKAYMTGSGAGQPLGVFVAHADGIPASRDVSEDNEATGVTADGLISAKYFLKMQYWANARWMGHRDFYKQVAKLKDGEGQYLWRESVRAGEPDRLLGFPTGMSEYAPNTFTTGQYVATLGDFSNYWIADSMMMTTQRLVELYAETNQVGLIGRKDTDGQPVLGEAFVRVKLG